MKTIEERVQILEGNFASLQQAFLQSQRNNTNTVSRVDDNANKVESITPYTETKTAYYGETEKTFYNVPEGNVTVFGLKEYSLDRISDRLTITFDALSEQTEITISIL